MNIKKQFDKVKKSLEGKTFDQLVEHFKEWENSGHYNAAIDNMLMDAMEAADANRFIEWAENYENGAE